MQGKELPSDDVRPAVSRDHVASSDLNTQALVARARACFGEHEVAQTSANPAPSPPILVSSLDRCIYTCILHLLRTSLHAVAHLSNTDVLNRDRYWAVSALLTDKDEP